MKAACVCAPRHSVPAPEAVGNGEGVRTEGGREKSGWHGVRRGAMGARAERGSHPPQRTLERRAHEPSGGCGACCDLSQCCSGPPVWMPSQHPSQHSLPGGLGPLTGLRAAITAHLELSENLREGAREGWGHACLQVSRHLCGGAPPSPCAVQPHCLCEG